MSAQIVEFPGSAPHDLPRMLRLLADDVEAGRKKLTDVVLVGRQGTDVSIYLWGAMRDEEVTALGMLTIASTLLTANHTMSED